MNSRGERILIAVVLILGILAIGSIFLNATGNVVFSRGSVGGGNSFSLSSSSIADLYYRYTQIFDFFLFLLFFIGLTQMILGKQFETIGLHKGVYVSIGLILSLGLVLWEYQTGYNLIELVGPFAILLLFAAGILLFFNILKGFHATGAGAIAATYLVFYIIFFILFDVYQAPFIDAIRYYLPFDIFSIMTILALGAGLVLVASLLRALFRRGSS